MKVSELIEKLKEMPQEYDVYTVSGNIVLTRLDKEKKVRYGES